MLLDILLFFCLASEKYENNFAPAVQNEKSESKALGYMAGTVGLEPTNGGVKVRCLTAWLRPNIFTTLILYYILAFLSISNIEKQGNAAAIFSQNTTPFFRTDNKKAKKHAVKNVPLQNLLFRAESNGYFRTDIRRAFKRDFCTVEHCAVFYYRKSESRASDCL